MALSTLAMMFQIRLESMAAIRWDLKQMAVY